MGWLFFGLLALCLGFALGWVHAHNTVARECEQLGQFYVGKTVYRCTSIDKVAK
jgi:hypothetical protein